MKGRPRLARCMCGKTPKMSVIHQVNARHFVYCPNCWAGPCRATRVKAREVWNGLMDMWAARPIPQLRAVPPLAEFKSGAPCVIAYVGVDVDTPVRRTATAVYRDGFWWTGPASTVPEFSIVAIGPMPELFPVELMAGAGEKDQKDERDLKGTPVGKG